MQSSRTRCGIDYAGFTRTWKRAMSPLAAKHTCVPRKPAMYRELIGLCACLIALIPAAPCPASAQSGPPPLTTTGTEPPVARKVPHVFEAFGHRRADDYAWMRNTP